MELTLHKVSKAGGTVLATEGQLLSSDEKIIPRMKLSWIVSFVERLGSYDCYVVIVKVTSSE